MNAALQAGAAPQLLAELKLADRIISAMLNTMTIQQKSKVHAQLEAAGITGIGMTRANERLAVIEVAADTSASITATSRQLRDIEVQAVDILSQAAHAGILLEAVFDKLDQIGEASPGVAAINCFATCTARAVALMRQAADNIVGLAAEGGAA